jgi:hypothetical protein
LFDLYVIDRDLNLVERFISPARSDPRQFVMDDSRQPGRETVWVAQLCTVPPSTYQRFLNNVLNVFAGTANSTLDQS